VNGVEEHLDQMDLMLAAQAFATPLGN